MDRYSNPALVIGSGVGNGVGIARNLHRFGVPVVSLSSNRYEVMRFSKYCHGAVICPHVEDDPRILTGVLEELTQAFTEPAVLFPVTDTAVLTVAQLPPRAQRYVTSSPSLSLAETMVKKKRFYQSLQSWSVPHPRTRFPDTHTLPEIERDISYPLYIRPSQSVPFMRAFGQKGFIAHNRQEATYYLTLAQAQRLEVMLQEIIPGPTTNGYVFRGYCDRHANLLMYYVTHKLRQESTFSNPPAIKSIPLRAQSPLGQFLSQIREYLSNIEYTGLFGAELKQDARDGSFKLLEINARSMGDSYTGVRCGVNDVFAAYRDALGEEVPPVRSYRLGVHYANPIKDVMVISALTRKGKPPKKLLQPYLQNHVFTYTVKDPLPFLMYLITFLYWERHKRQSRQVAPV